MKEKFNVLSQEVIKCLRDISVKRMHLDADVLAQLLSHNGVVTGILSAGASKQGDNAAELKHWKDIYIKLKTKCTDCSRGYTRKEKLLRKIILIVDNIMLSSCDTTMSEELNFINSAIIKDPSLNTLNKCLLKLYVIANKLKIKDIAPELNGELQEGEEPAEMLSPLEVEVNTKKTIFYELLNRLYPLLPGVGRDIKAVQGDIEKKYALVEAAKFIDEVIILIESQNSFFEVQKDELKGTILMLLSELNETEKNISMAFDTYKEKTKSDSDFHKNLSNKVSDIEGSFSISDDISELREVVSKKAKEISVSIKHKIQDDIVKSGTINSELMTLKTRIKKAHTEVKRYKKRAKHLELEANTDPLTNIPNRRSLNAKLTDEYERFKRYKAPCSILLLDLDKFKSINDSFGHSTGDSVLVKIAYILKKNIRACDFIGRFGGEEFLIILPQTELDDALQIAEKLRKIIDKSKFYYQNEQVHVAVSIGVTHFIEDDSVKVAFERADLALYAAKKTGRNKVVQYEEGIVKTA